MKPLILFGAVTLAGLVAAGPEQSAGGGQQGGDRITVPFSDPARPGTVKINIIHGSITVHGTNRRDVTVAGMGRDEREVRVGRGEGRGRGIGAGNPDAASQGLHRLTQAPSFGAEEENNVISIGGPPSSRSTDLDVEVPAKVNLHVSTVNDGSITIEGVDGDLEVNNVNGPITLTSVGGSVVAHTVNGALVATLVRVTPQKPMAFTSLNGKVDVTLPATTKANLRLRSDQGDVYTDFDVQLKTSPAAPVENRSGGGGKYRIEVNKAIYGAINGGGPDIELRTFNGSIYVRKSK